MATFELRRDAQGRVNAVRVKVRRVGQPHMSRTFQLEGRGPAALAAARREAAQWLAGLETALGSVAQELISAAVVSDAAAVQVAQRRSPSVAAAFAQAGRGAGGVKAAKAEPALPPTALSPAHRLLHELLQCGALSVPELSALRWQHVAWHERWLNIPGPSGLTVRRVPLRASACEALMAMGSRKHGLIFPGGPEWLVAAWPAPSAPGSAAVGPKKAQPSA